MAGKIVEPLCVCAALLGEAGVRTARVIMIYDYPGGYCPGLLLICPAPAAYD